MVMPLALACMALQSDDTGYHSPWAAQSIASLTMPCLPSTLCRLRRIINISYPLILSVLPLLASGTYTESDRCRPLAHSYAYIGHEDCYAVWDGELMMVLKNCAPDRHPTFSASQLALRQIHILLLAPSASRARIDATESNTSDGTLGGEQ
jgi:hypothetical protein